MEIRWRFHGDSMEIRWRDHGETMVDPRPPDHQNETHFDTFSTHVSSFCSEARECMPKSLLGGSRRGLAAILGLSGVHFEARV